MGEGDCTDALALTLQQWENLTSGRGGGSPGQRRAHRDTSNSKPHAHLSSHLLWAVFLHLQLKRGSANTILKGLTVKTETSRSHHGP